MRLSVLVTGVFLLTSLATQPVWAQGSDLPAPKSSGKVPKSATGKMSYAIGYDIGQNILNAGVDLETEVIIQGMKDALAKAKPSLTKDQLEEAMKSFQKEVRTAQSGRIKKLLEKNKKEGSAYLKANKSKPGVKTLASGLQYKVIKSGKGKTPKLTDKVKTHYRGTLIDGTEFDSSYARKMPAEFEVQGVIRGWTEALQKMKVGDKWQLFVPSDLAYGERGSPGIEPNTMLIFEIELLDIVK